MPILGGWAFWMFLWGKLTDAWFYLGIWNGLIGPWLGATYALPCYNFPVFCAISISFNLWIISSTLYPNLSICFDILNFSFFDWWAWNFKPESEANPSGAIDLAIWGGVYPGGKSGL